MRDHSCYKEITMLAEDRVTTSISSVYTRINPVNYSAIDNPDVIGTGEFGEDPFDVENDRHHGFSRDNPHVINTTTNVVVLPSVNKWNCFSIRDRRSIDVIGSRDNMNTATSVSPTSTLEINHIFGDRVADYPAQASRSTGTDLTQNASGYRRLTLREKLAKQRTEKESESKSDGNSVGSRRLTKAASSAGVTTAATDTKYKTTVRGQNNDSSKVDSSEQPPRLTKATSAESASTPTANSHRPASRSKSVAAITEEKTVFGFKVMKGLQGSSDTRTTNNSTGFSRHGSYRQPSRTTSYSSPNRFTDKAGTTLFYTPKNNRASKNAVTSEQTKAETQDALKRTEDSRTEAKADVMENPGEQRRLSTGKKADKDASSAVGRTDLNVGGKGTKNVDVRDKASAITLENALTNPDSESTVHDGDVFRVSKEIEVKNDEGKTEKLLIRAESLREGKTRLEKFREKQKVGEKQKLTRSLTNPDFEENDNTAKTGKGKNISESLAEIRERIRERKRKKEMLKKSQSMPETDLPPKQESEEFLHDDKNDLLRNSETNNGKEITKGSSEDIKNNVGAKPEGEKSVSGERMEKKGSNLNKTEYLEIEENSKVNNVDENVTVMDSGKEDVMAQTEGEKNVIGTEDKVELENTNDSDSNVERDKTENIGKDTNDLKEGDKLISEGKKIELKEILSKEKNESTGDAKSEVETTVTNAKTSNSEEEKSEVKKPTKRERRKRERYQRSKTMSAIMYNEISLDARREQRHKGDERQSEDKSGEPVTVLSVSEIKKRFAEADNGGSKMSELGLFYSGTSASEKSSGTLRSSLRSKSGEKRTVKDDSAAGKGKGSKGRTKAYVSRRHTLATGVTFHNQTAENKDVKQTNTETVKVNVDKNKTSEGKGKISLGRRHTLPSFTTEITVQCTSGPSSSTDKKKDVSEGGRRLPSRRHTFCSETSFMVTRHKPAKVPESVGTLREKFSKGEAPVFQLATSDKTSSDNDGKKQSRRTNSGDSTVRKIIEEAKMLKNADKDAGSGSSLTRRHTIANRPKRENSEKNELEKQEFLEKFLAKDEDINPAQNVEEKTSTDDRESKATDSEQASKHSKDKLSVSKLRKLFHGQNSGAEKKSKLRERRAKTIAGGISPDILKELKINKNNDVLPDKYITEPGVNDTDTIKNEGKTDKPERRRRSSDLNPDNYLSPEPLTSEETATIPVFSDDKPSQGDVQPDIVLSTVKAPAESSGPEFPSGRRRSVSESDMKMAGSSTGEEDETSSDLVDLKTPTEATLSRSGSVSEKDKSRGGAGTDQCLDEYLNSAIKTLTENPKSQKASPRGSPQKGKITSSQSFDHNDKGPKTMQNLDVVKSSLSMHSWSTSDLDKIIHGGNGVSPSASQVDISTMDLDEISNSTTRLQSLTEGRTKVRPKRTTSKSLNPMKSLMERTDVRTSTEEPEEEETSSGFEKPKKRTTPRKKRSQLEPWRRHTLDPVALAALASREDFSRVSLRRTKGPGKEKDEYGGSLPVMLIQIKGRRQVQTRLVEPSLSSLNTGDCFILVTPKELFCWIGQHANTIEKAKAVEIASKIQKRGDLNCKTGDVLYIDETKQGNNLAYRKFCKILEGDTDFPIEDAQLCPDDEFYEREVISTNKVYKLQEGDPPHLIPVTELCGYMPRIAILNTKEVFVFDFGSELYLWTGQQSLSNKRKVAFHLAEMLYKQQFDCEAVVSPVDPRRPRKRTQSSQPVYRDAEGKECGRPKWTLFGKLHEKAETLLFREKFFDWPDPTKIIKMKGHVSSGELPERPPSVELKPCDPTEMQRPAGDLEPVILEATNLGRGSGTPNVEVNGEVKEGDLVTTLGTKVWLVTQNKHFDLPKASEGHFHSGDGYVIRWVYFVAKNRIVRDKRGRVRPLTGRQRCAYFFWQGNECSVNEKGAAAIMAVELDEEHGPQIRVVEGKEPPHFLKLFDGGMVIHSGKRIRVDDDSDEFSDKSTVRMYCVRNEDSSEGCLVQVKRSASSLRSRSSFIVVDSEHGNVFVWHGCKTNEYHRKSAEKAASLIKEKCPLEMNLSEEMSLVVAEMEEGKESKQFWSTVGRKKSSYLSLRKEPASYDFSPRLFHMTSATGTFTSIEILNPSRYSGRTCPFPVLQDDLYSASQPTAFMLDVGDEVYVWEGWMPVEITKDKRGSAKRRWDEERKLTLQTTLSYIEEAKSRINKGAFVVQAGLEPACFTTHFPFWNRQKDITEIQKREGKTDCEKKTVQEALDAFAKKFYTFKQLTSDSPPDGVDPSKLETYLNDEEFERIFEMPPDLFNKLPGWKQDILKKAFGLF